MNIPGYTVGDELSRGRFGILYEARNHAGRRVAVKALSTADARHELHVCKILYEAYPKGPSNVVRYLDYKAVGRDTYIVFELFDYTVDTLEPLCTTPLALMRFLRDSA